MNESCKVYGNEETEMKGKGPSMRDKTDAGMQCDILEGEVTRKRKFVGGNYELNFKNNFEWLLGHTEEINSGH